MPAHPALPTSRPSVLRAALGAAALAGLSATLIGCGSDDGASETTTAPIETPAPESSAPPAAAFPVTIEGALGSTTITAAPQRVLSVGSFRDTDAAVAFGVVPIATPDLSFYMEGGVSPWVAREIGDATMELIEVDAEVGFEKVAELKPDLILATDDTGLEENWSILTEIAPTLSYANGYNQDEWQLTTRRVGEALGRADQVDALIASVTDAVAAARAAHPEFEGMTFTFGPVTGEGKINTINSTTDASVIFLESLGLELSPAVMDLPDALFPGRAEISMEQLELLDADVMLLTFNTAEARADLEANPLFQSIPAVQEGRYLALELPVAIALGFPSALSIPYGLEQVVPQLSAVLD